MRKRIILVGLAGFLCLGTCSYCHAQNGKTVLKRVGSQAEYVDSAVFYQGRNEYKIFKGNVSYPIPAADVEYVQPPRPVALLTGAKNVVVLEKIVSEYRGRWWDVEASKLLLPLYINGGTPDKAVKLFQDMKSALKDGELPVALERAYWSALRASHKETLLESELQKAVSDGSREASASAYLSWGDLFAGRRDLKRALVDGYLRVVLRFQDVYSCRKEALTKTIATLEQLGDSRAQRFRVVLQKEFSLETSGG